jgi:phage gp36-like protein
VALRQGYCQPEDLLLGKIALPRGISAEAVIAQAANEMDSYLGRRYAIPVAVDATVPAQRSDALYLSNINAQLATGRLITSAAAGGEADSVHAYGRMLMTTAINALNGIADGKVDLTSAAPADDAVSVKAAPRIYTKDKHSLVDSFYDTYAEPGWVAGGMKEGNGWQTFP